MKTGSAVHACPRCHLRFDQEAELLDHHQREHPGATAAPPRPDGRVVLAVDPARADPRVAVGVASAVASQLGAALDVVAATPAGLGEETTQSYLRDRVRECRGHGAPWVGWHGLGTAPPAAAIAAHTGASTTETWLCLATRARTAVGEKVFGSVTEEVLRTSAVPVLLVGPRAGTTDVPFSRVIACVDRSSQAPGVVEAASELADRLGARLVLVEVSMPDIDGTPIMDEDHLRALADRLDRPVETVRLAGHREWEPILDLVQRDPTTVLVTGRRPADAPSRFVAGSVTTNLARRAVGPVMVVPGQVPE